MVVIILTFLAAMVLSIVPLSASLPVELSFLRPDWIAMALIYWVMALPHRVGLFMAWLLGLMTDVVLNNALGQHALSYLIIAWVTFSLHQRLRFFGIWKQALVVAGLLGLNQLLIVWLGAALGRTAWSYGHLLPALSGGLLWPWSFLLLRHLRRRYEVV